jgi:hypothetical protein
MSNVNISSTFTTPGEYRRLLNVSVVSAEKVGSWAMLESGDADRALAHESSQSGPCCLNGPCRLNSRGRRLEKAILINVAQIHDLSE